MRIFSVNITTTPQKILSYREDRVIIVLRSNVDFEFSHRQDSEYFPVSANSIVSLLKSDNYPTELEVWVKSSSVSGTLWVVEV